MAFGAPADDVDGPSDEVSSLNEVGDASELVQGLRGRQRERLIAATAKAVEERGLAKVRVADMVRHAGVAQTIFYKHFANKEECIEAAFGASFASLVETAGRRRLACLSIPATPLRTHPHHSHPTLFNRRQVALASPTTRYGARSANA